MGHEPRSRTGAGLEFRAVLLLNAGLVAAHVLLLLQMTWRDEFWRSDFSGFYTGWSIVLDGHGDRLYDLALQAEYQDRVVPERVGQLGLLPFVYPPHTALLRSPLALFPWRVAFLLWTLLQVGMLALAVRFLCDLARAWSSGERAVLIVALLAFPPLLMTFQLGQLSLAALLCLLGFYRGLERDAPAEMGLWLVLGSFKPQLVLFPALLLLADRRWRALAWTAGLFAAWAVPTTLLLGPACWMDFLGVLRHNASQFGTGGVDPLRMYNLKGLLTGLLGGGHAALVNVLSGAALLLAAGAVLALWRRPLPAGTPHFRLRVALTLLLGLLANPHFNFADALVLALPAVLFYDALRTQSPVAARAFGALAACCPLLFWLDTALGDAGRLAVRPFFLLLLGVCLWMTWALARPAAAPAPAPAG